MGSLTDTDGGTNWRVAGSRSPWPEAPSPSRMELDSPADAIIDQFIIVSSDV